MSHTQKRPVARGVKKGEDKISVVVHLPDEMFNQVRQRALAEGTSWGEQARLLIEWGLMDAEEMSSSQAGDRD